MTKKREPSPKPEPSSDEEEFEEVEEVEEEEEEEEEDEDEVEEEEVEEEEEEDPSSRESIRKLLEPFGKDQLIELLKDAALKNPALISRITGSSAPASASAPASDPASDPAVRKIFVHGLGWDATTEILSAAFSPYGEIEECKAVLDRATGRCKGFGFVLFRTPAAARKALKEPQKKIGPRMTSCQLASVGPTKDQRDDADPAARKIFVSGIGAHISPEHLRSFFARFGEIEEGPLGVDPITGRLLRFAIFVYRTVEGCKKALEEPLKFFEGCELHCKGETGGAKQTTAGMLGHFQPSDLALASQAMMNRSSAGFVGQNAVFGMLDPAADMAGFRSSFNRSDTNPYGVGLGFGREGLGVNTISPSVIGRYESPVLGAAYENSPSTTAMRYQSGIRYMGTDLPPYYGR